MSSTKTPRTGRCRDRCRATSDEETAMITRRVFVAMLLTMLCLAEGIAAPPLVVLTGDELDRRSVAVGMLVEVVYGQGARHGFSGAWARLATVRGVVERVDWDRRQLVVAREEDETKATVVIERIQTMTVIGRTPLADSQAQDEPDDSLIVKNMHPPSDIENKGLRVLAKLGVGTFSGIAFTVLAIGAMDATDTSEEDSSDNTHRGVGLFLLGSLIGSGVGVPLGVTSVDPYDSSSKTLLAGVIPVVVGIGLGRGGAEMAYIGPVLSSLIASEISRKPPQGSQKNRVSVRLGPVPNGGLSTSITLRF